MFRFILRITSSVQAFIWSLVSAPYKVYFLRSPKIPRLLLSLLRPPTYDALTSYYLQNMKLDLIKIFSVQRRDKPLLPSNLSSTIFWEHWQTFRFISSYPTQKISVNIVSEDCLWAPVNVANFYRSLNSLCQVAADKVDSAKSANNIAKTMLSVLNCAVLCCFTSNLWSKKILWD